MLPRFYVFFTLLISVLGQSVFPSESSLAQFRQGAEPTIGALFFTTVLIIVIVYMVKQHGAPFVTPLNFSGLPEREQTRTAVRMGLLLCTILLMIIGFFHLFGTEWLVAYQILGFALIGFLCHLGGRQTTHVDFLHFVYFQLVLHYGERCRVELYQ